MRKQAAQPHATTYLAYLQNKIDEARLQFEGGKYLEHADVEAEFAQHREQLKKQIAD